MSGSVAAQAGRARPSSPTITPLDSGASVVLLGTVPRQALRAPAGGHQEPDDGDAEARHDVPGLPGLDREAPRDDVAGDDPEEADDHEFEHARLEPHGVGLV